MTSPFRFEKRFRDGGKRGAAGDAALPRCGSVDAGVAPVDLPSLERSAVLGKTTMSDTQLLRLGRGAVVALDRKVGESIDILFHNRLLARGEAVILDNLSRGTMTEINESEP